MPALGRSVAAPIPHNRAAGDLTVLRLLIDPVACDAYGYCAELLPEAISLDEWGYPILDGTPLPDELGGRREAGGAGLPSARHHGAEASASTLTLWPAPQWRHVRGRT